MRVDPTPGVPTFKQVEEFLKTFGWDFDQTKLVSVKFGIHEIEIYEYETDMYGRIKAEKDSRGQMQPVGRFRHIPYRKEDDGS